MTTRVIKNISELTTNDPSHGTGVMGRLHDAALVIDDERVLWVGANADAPAADEMIDAQDSAVIPGFVDSHTHLVFAGERSEEFEARMNGTPYDGGGIARTVESTRAASSDELRRATKRWPALRELRSGVTTVEIKSGYALNLDGESRLIDVANEFSDEVTFLGAHVVPEEYVKDRDAYVDLVRGPMLDACAPRSKWADVFCDRGAFDVDEARAILMAARTAGLQLRVHGNQLGATGGVALAVELDAASVDHCTFLSDDDIEQLAASATVATLLPGADFSTRADYSSARRLLDRGAVVALATDCNPGTSYVTSMGFVLAIAVRDMRMSFDEALWCATRGGAKALRRDDIGHLSVGARADLVILDAPRAAHLAYRPGGSSLVRQVICRTGPTSTGWFGAHGVESVMAESGVEIRPIVEGDWDRVFEIFSEVVAEGETYAYPEDLTSEGARALWVEGPPGDTVVALRDHVILGTAKFGPNRPARGSHVATASFMVAADSRGFGCRDERCVNIRFLGLENTATRRCSSMPSSRRTCTPSGCIRISDSSRSEPCPKPSSTRRSAASDSTSCI